MVTLKTTFRSRNMGIEAKGAFPDFDKSESYTVMTVKSQMPRAVLEVIANSDRCEGGGTKKELD